MHGLPLVVAPITDDQPVIADQVVARGAGIRINFRRSKSEVIYDAMMKVLSDPSYRKNAEAVKTSLVASEGARGAAELILGLIKK
jgi:UDP:flavonoid glycosyltransferase YjiC (YdhE family)